MYVSEFLACADRAEIQDLSHNTERNEANKSDPLCEQVGSLRGVADMLNLGALLVSAAPLEKFPKDTPLLVYHGDEDNICSVDASREFVEKCGARDKTHYAVKVSCDETIGNKLMEGNAPRSPQ